MERLTPTVDRSCLSGRVCAPLLALARFPCWINVNAVTRSHLRHAHLSVDHPHHGSTHRFGAWARGNKLCCHVWPSAPSASREQEEQPLHAFVRAVHACSAVRAVRRHRGVRRVHLHRTVRFLPYGLLTLSALPWLQLGAWCCPLVASVGRAHRRVGGAGRPPRRASLA